MFYTFILFEKNAALAFFSMKEVHKVNHRVSLRSSLCCKQLETLFMPRPVHLKCMSSSAYRTHRFELLPRTSQNTHEAQQAIWLQSSQETLFMPRPVHLKCMSSSAYRTHRFELLPRTSQNTHEAQQAIWLQSSQGARKPTPS